MKQLIIKLQERTCTHRDSCVGCIEDDAGVLCSLLWEDMATSSASVALTLRGLFCL